MQLCIGTPRYAAEMMLNIARAFDKTVLFLEDCVTQGAPLSEEAIRFKDFCIVFRTSNGGVRYEMPDAMSDVVHKYKDFVCLVIFACGKSFVHCGAVWYHKGRLYIFDPYRLSNRLCKRDIEKDVRVLFETVFHLPVRRIQRNERYIQSEQEAEPAYDDELNRTKTEYGYCVAWSGWFVIQLIKGRDPDVEIDRLCQTHRGSLTRFIGMFADTYASRKCVK